MSPPTPQPRGGLDWQLVALGAVLWVVAMGIVLSKWTRVRVDWQLGNIKERLDFSGIIDDEAVDTLVAMGTGNPAIVSMIGDEITGPQRNLDPRYRIALVKTLGLIPGPEALAMLIECLRVEYPNGDARVRATVYLWMLNRTRTAPTEQTRVLEVLETMVDLEPEPIARAFVVKALGELGKLTAPRIESCWYFIATFREAEDRDIPAAASQRDKEDLAALLRQIRAECVSSLAALAKVGTDRYPLDPAATDEVRAAQVQAWEEWYVGTGKELPKGQLRYPEWLKQQEEIRARAGSAPVGTQGGGAGGPGAPGSQGPGG